MFVNNTSWYIFADMEAPKLSKSAQTKKYIIERIAATFNRKGYGGTSLSDITELTGLTKGSIYGNFSNKDEIALAAFEYNIQNLYNPVIELVSSRSHAIDKLLEYPKFFKSAYKEIFAYGGCAILNAAVEADDTHPELRKRVNKVIKTWEKRLVNIIEEGQSKKEIQPRADARKYASLFITLFEGGIMLSKSTGDKSYIFTALSHMEQLITSELKYK